MLLKRFEAEGLAHYSYMVGDENAAVVIDPQRDCDVYVEAARTGGFSITHILETHRNEDYVTGSVELAEVTGAKILHADWMLDYAFGSPVSDGDTIPVGRLKIEAIHTPGHTPGHMSYLLYDAEGNPWVVFTGDSLFAGDVGRTDFLGAEKLSEMTGLMYDSIFKKLLPLGDQVIVCPAHGAGSVCGAGIADRQITTIGLERLHNPRLRFTERDDFIKTGKMLDRSPYFRKMEVLNVEGPPILNHLPLAQPLRAAQFAAAMDQAAVLDARSEEEFGASHIPGSLFLPPMLVPVYAGYYLTYDQPVLLVADPDKAESLIRRLVRIGYDNIAGILSGGMSSWQMSGRSVEVIKMVSSKEFCAIFESKREDIAILDVRTPEEVAKGGPVEGAVNIKLTSLMENIDAVPKDKEIIVMCGSGRRAMVGAGLLKRNGFGKVTVVLGGIMGWKAACSKKGF